MGANQSAPLAAALDKLAAEVRSSGGNDVQLRALLPRFKQLAEAVDALASNERADGSARRGARP
eukprot:7197794-Prymnesium_polylepis.1